MLRSLRIGLGKRRGTVARTRHAAVPGVREAELRQEPNRLVRVLKILGPGLITGASDDDPSGIATYAAAGAAFGTGLLWMAPATVPLMLAVQFICSKIGLVTGKGLAGVLRQHYPRTIVYPAVIGLVIANTINAGADLGSIAAACQLFAPIPGAVLLPAIAVLLLGIQFWGSYRFLRYALMLLTLSLLGYVASAVFIRPDWGAVMRETVMPRVSLNGRFLAMVVAILGTTISPYLFFWQASQEVEDEMSRGHTRVAERRGTTDRELHYAGWDTAVGMGMSNIIMFFIILATGATLYRVGHHDVRTAADAAQALRPFAGAAAEAVLAFALIGSGMLAVPVLTGSAAYAVCELGGWPYGFHRKPGESKAFYVVIAASTMAGLAINLFPVDPFALLFWAAVINGFLAPPLLILLMRMSSDPRILKDRVNGPALNILGWTTTALMFGAALALLWTWHTG